MTKVPARWLQDKKHSEILSTLLKHKIILVGYDSFRRRTATFLDGTHVNTPWQGESGNEENGTPLVLVEAVALENLLQGRWLREVPLIVNIVQTTVVAIASFFVWRLPPSYAVLLLVFFYSLLIYSNSLVFSFLCYCIPLADTFLFGMFAAIAGALATALEKGKRKLSHSLALMRKEELSRVQGHFLNRFFL